MEKAMWAPGIRYWRDDAVEGARIAQANYGAHTFAPHLHDELVIVVTVGGAGSCCTKSANAVAGPGSVWVFEPGEYHRGEVWENKTWRYWAVYLDTAGSPLHPVDAANDHPGRSALSLRPGLHVDRLLSKSLQDALTSVTDGSACSLLERQANWCDALSLFYDRYGASGPVQSAPPARTCGRMSVVRDFLADNYNKDTSIDELAELVNLSRFHLMRSFTKEYGLAPHAYANQVRLLAAKQMLTRGATPATAALAAGFYDQSHFNRMFKRAYGISPGSYVRVIG